MISIREAEVGDIPVLNEFNRRLAKETEDVDLDEETLRRGLTAMFEDSSKGRYYVAEEVGGEIVGCHSITFEWSDWRNGVVWWIQSVYVKQEYRKKGVFRLMYENLQKVVRDDPSIKGLRLYAYKGNAVAHKAYEAMGMTSDHYEVFEHMKQLPKCQETPTH